MTERSFRWCVVLLLFVTYVALAVAVFLASEIREDVDDIHDRLIPTTTNPPEQAHG